MIVVVVTWNAERSISACLESIPTETRVIVVDNASSDQTVSIVRRLRGDAQVAEQRQNRGFAAAANIGLEMAANREYALLLNPDAMLGTSTLDDLIAFADARPEAGLVSAGIVDQSTHAERFAAGHDVSLTSVAIHALGLSRLLSRWSLYDPPRRATPTRREWVAGTCLLVRMEAVRQVGVLDGRYFLYCEDIDWCRRMRDAGWEAWVVPAARAVHGRSMSVNAAGAWVDRYRIGSLDQYFSARHGWTARTAFRALQTVGMAGRAVAFTLFGRIIGKDELVRRGRQRARDARIATRLLLRGRLDGGLAEPTRDA